MPTYERRRLDVPPSAAELARQQELLKAPPQSRIQGYGALAPVEPRKPPDKPGDTPAGVKKWLDDSTVQPAQ